MTAETSANRPIVKASRGPGRAVVPVALENRPIDESAQTQAGLKRLRTYRSCKPCRNSKTRCTGERPTCLRCQQRRLECLYDGKQAPAWVDTVLPATRTQHGSPRSTDQELQAPTPASTPAERHVRQQSDQPAQISSREEVHHGDHSQGYCPNEFSWLMSPELPDKEKIVILAEEFFANIHNIRSFGFVHKPSYMQQLDEQSPAVQRESSLLHAICALGAKFYALKCGEQNPLPEDFALRVGNQWASKAKLNLFMNMTNVSVQNTMAVVLLHEHDLRVGNFASAFLLTGFGVRMAQALQINLERSSNILTGDGKLLWSCREARRRLMWSIYIMDACVGTGVDELTLIRESDIKIQLPCNERNFMLQIPCIVETLQKGEYLPFVSAKDRSDGPVDTPDLQAQYIRLMSLRGKVLRYVKHLDTELAPWLPASEYTNLEKSLLAWYEDLPNSLQFTRTALNTRKELSQLGALLVLHWTYHATLCDLYRIERLGFQERVQDCCFEHATATAIIFEEALRHNFEVFADTWLPIIAHDATRVIVHYATRKLGTSRDRQVMTRPHAISCMQANISALKRMVPIFQLGKPLYAAASNMVREGGFDINELADEHLARTNITQDNDSPVTLEPPPQFTPDYILNPLAIYRMARRDIDDQEKYAPERIPPTAATQSTDSLSQQPETPPVPASFGPNVEPANPPAFVGSWFESGTGNTITVEDNFQLPSSFDNLQAYFPLMFNNFSLPVQGSFGELGPRSHVSDFNEGSVPSYQPPDVTMPDLMVRPASQNEYGMQSHAPQWTS
ncbi:hypothetical protein JX265_000184 [Neoarthrinium moseri]|uniref:Zn(2)-C6 fungal-type domain-containing protein n=1 Tax=Neoarthrinium moseri TaxID=1658444 RepID=A0A9Q0AUN7_9PEZI|nr:hypothetical protein JX265_000184 [Neoarthrinium moseri]